MTISIEIETTVFEYLPVIARARVEPPDRSVGIYQAEVTDIELLWPARKKDPPTRYRPLSSIALKRISQEQWERIGAEVVEQNGYYHDRDI